MDIRNSGIDMHGGVIENFADFEAKISKAQASFGHETKLVAILFMREGQEITDKMIRPSLKYFDLRSGKDMHFILPGWSKRIPGRGADTTDSGWVFRESHFIKACDVISDATEWRYSGGTDLLLLTTRRMSTERAVIDFSGAINIPLHVLKEKRLVESPELVLERVIRFAKNYNGDDPISSFSLQEARVSLAEGILSFLVGFLAKDARSNLDYARQFLIRDISKRQRSQDVVVKISGSSAERPNKKLLQVD
ncbi:hypothetical protein [Rhizobium leguminosarum]|uniref:hypothetical protein n=1 Tax=Rhizobium leguminosarum TaxID=384 RepID=UPI0014419B04|nr:hypothetical protein [Rhizobium leguminosarum]MBY5868526.1 hypothetical protein [Rhizobium leguminosarum]NKM07696.1 hypothetical protein [Rhizobium leguminosarum bv. viciae]